MRTVELHAKCLQVRSASVQLPSGEKVLMTEAVVQDRAPLGKTNDFGWEKGEVDTYKYEHTYIYIHDIYIYIYTYMRCYLVSICFECIVGR